MQIKFVCNENEGVEGMLEVTPDSTVLQILEKNLNGEPENYFVRIDRVPVGELPDGFGTVLQPGQTVSATPAKIAAA